MDATIPADDATSDWILSVLGLYVGGPPAAEAIEAGALDGDQFRPYLLARLKQTKQSGAANFGIVFGRHPPEHRIAMHRTMAPRSLAAGLVRSTGLHAVTWGVAEPHPERPATLRLTLEGRLLPGLCKKGGRMLRVWRPLPFARMVLHDGDVELPDVPDPLDTELDDPPPAGVPPAPNATSVQRDALAAASRQRVAFCEECPRA